MYVLIYFIILHLIIVGKSIMLGQAVFLIRYQFHSSYQVVDQCT